MMSIDESPTGSITVKCIHKYFVRLNKMECPFKFAFTSSGMYTCEIIS